MRTYAIPVMGGRFVSCASAELARRRAIRATRVVCMRESIPRCFGNVTCAKLRRPNPRKDTALPAAEHGQVQSAHDVERLCGRDRQLRLPQYRVADILVIVREARGGGWNRLSALGRGQLTVHLGRFSIPTRLVG